VDAEPVIGFGACLGGIPAKILPGPGLYFVRHSSPRKGLLNQACNSIVFVLNADLIPGLYIRRQEAR
jgi:hypothetical protein